VRGGAESCNLSRGVPPIEFPQNGRFGLVGFFGEIFAVGRVEWINGSFRLFEAN